MEAEGASFTPPFEEKTDAPRQPSDLAGAQRLWNGVLQGLKQRHKMGFFAYAREATPLDFDGKGSRWGRQRNWPRTALNAMI